MSIGNNEISEEKLNEISKYLKFQVHSEILRSRSRSSNSNSSSSLSELEDFLKLEILRNAGNVKQEEFISKEEMII